MTKADNSKERLEDAMQSLSSLGIPLVKTWGSVRFINTIGRKLWSVNQERNGLPKGHTRSHPTPTRGRDGRSSCRGWGWASAGVDEVLKPGMVAASDAWRKPMECDRAIKVTDCTSTAHVGKGLGFKFIRGCSTQYDGHISLQ